MNPLDIISEKNQGVFSHVTSQTHTKKVGIILLKKVGRIDAPSNLKEKNGVV